MGLDLFDRPSNADTGVRNEHDYYETPRFMTASLLHHHPISGSVFEPCAGDGAIARALVAAGFQTVLTNDIDVQHATTFHADATQLDIWSHSALAGINWVITNPPFNVAFPILEQAERLARVGVAMLLRKTFLEPTTNRGPWFSVHPPTRVIGLPRHNFRGNGSDSCAADWYIWEREPDRSLQPFVIDHVAKTRRIA